MTQLMKAPLGKLRDGVWLLTQMEEVTCKLRAEEGRLGGPVKKGRTWFFLKMPSSKGGLKGSSEVVTGD